MIRFHKVNNLLLLEYESPEGLHWLLDKFNNNQKVTIRKIYTFSKNDLYADEDSPDENNLEELDSHDVYKLKFVIAELDGNFYKFKREILSISVDLHIHKNIEINDKMFRAERDISVFKKINKIVREDIYIGDTENSNLPLIEFERLLKNFPNTYELNKYTSARISTILRDYFDNSIDGIQKYENYLNKKISFKGLDLLSIFQSNEKIKYETILNKLQQMLDDEDKYNEKQWQREILQIILLLYPKYINVFEEVPVKDIYNNTTRRLDYMLVDTNGNIDIVEIKRPFSINIVSHNKYRDNHIPLRELSGSIMQIEKYIYCLNKWGKKGEDKLSEKYKDELPDNFRIKIINPDGIIIMGRENKLATEQTDDFEVIKRKYKNIIDIITYDELISRLEIIINKFR